MRKILEKMQILLQKLFDPIVQLSAALGAPFTPSIPELIWVKNVRAIVVCGFLMKFSKNLKKIVGAVWELPAK